MAQPADGVVVKDTLVFLFAAGVVVPVMRSLRVPAVVGFMLAGVALGPSGLGALSDDWAWLSWFTMTDPAAAAPFAELGVLFLLFLIGLELSFSKLWSLRRLVFGAGALQTGLSALAIGLVASAFGMEAIAAATIGLALALSSTAIVMQVLINEREAATQTGQASLGVLLFQDVMVAPILIFVSFATHEGSGSLLSQIGEATLQGFFAIAIIVLIGRFVLGRAFRLAADAGGRDFLMAITLFTIVGAAVLTFSAGLSLALGAFLAGLLLGETEFRHQTEVDLEPFKGLLLGLFFMTVGMGIDLALVWSLWPVVLACITALVIGKALIAFAAVRLVTGSTQTALQSALLLAPAGEFAFVIMAAAVTSGLFLPNQVALVSAVAGLSMVMIPLFGLIGSWLAAKLDEKEDEDVAALSDFTELSGHVIIAGFGRVGEAIAHILDAEQAELVGLEQTARRVARARGNDWNVYLGDATRPEILKQAGAEGASLFVVTVDDADAATAMVKAIRSLRGEAPVLVRAQDVDHARLLLAAGATSVIPDAIEAGLQLAGLALREFGYDGETIRDRLAAERDKEYRIAEGLA